MLEEIFFVHGARNWNEALPLGNGRLGAMLRGDPRHETLWLNEDTLWSGYPTRQSSEDAPAWFRRASELVQQGRYANAQQVLQQHHTGAPTQCYLPLAQIEMDFEGESGEGWRRLDLGSGIHTVSGDTCTRECFISHPDQVLAMRLLGREGGSVNFTLQLLPALDGKVSIGEDRINITGNAPVMTYTLGKPQHEAGRLRYGTTPETSGMFWFAQVRVILQGGRIQRRGGGLTITGADSCVLLFNARTSFNGWDKHPVLEGKQYQEPCLAAIDMAEAQSYDALRERHVQDHSSLYRRVCLNLRHDEMTIQATEELLRQHERGIRRMDLYELYYNFGRYLTIAGSREDTQAMNLQGIWNDHLTAPWNGNYTININTEMNYWPTLASNLAECQQPLIRLITQLCQAGELTARSWYDAPGSVAHHNTDIWRHTTPVGCRYPGSARWANWDLSLGWLCQHLWQRWEYTQDQIFLRDVAWPVMRSASRFYISRLRKNEQGKLVLTPSTSPQNCFVDEQGREVAVAPWTAMSQSILQQLFRNTAAAGRVLGAERDVIDRLMNYSGMLEGPVVGARGQLLEWSEEFPQSEPWHRHISHLYALHPGSSISPDRTPLLADACRRTLERRGDESTGWAMGWRICQWARLHDGDHALKLLDTQLQLVDSVKSDRGGTYLNLFDAHPPFQIDGNFGAISGMNEMLLQSHLGYVQLLPALPSAWPDGSITGLRARGGYTVDIYWREGKLVRADFLCSRAGELKLSTGRCFSHQPGDKITIEGGDD